ncbi:hypothetical protein L9F63_017213 [Diploptera punctata]|uniref:DUF8207 domain-containing protein n=1 Tax=Diploptera punctata TaxID=6984 RepID=A0AAD8A000_DIPPU|nr:hypothetical protein L9F63_017213 [Diploptera punctata]
MYVFYKEWFWMIDIYNKQAEAPQLITNWPSGEVVIFIDNLFYMINFPIIEHEHSMSLVPQTYVPPTYVKPTSTSKPTSSKAITQYATSSIGPIISKYLGLSKMKNAGGSVFGLFGGEEGKIYMGDSKVVFDNDNLIINGNKYKATEGLMSLLTLEQPNQNLPEDDMINYEKNLINTNCIYQNNSNIRKPKSSRSEKYKSIISPIWERMKKGVSKSNQYFSPSRRDSDSDVGSGEKKKEKKHSSGKGLQKYTELPKEFILTNEVRKLVDRLIVIMGEEQSGNDNLYNEKVSIMKMFNETLANFILQDPKNIGHLIKIINMLPPKFWSKEAFGSDLLMI